MMKSILTILLFINASNSLFGQSYFFGGYGIGFYLAKEAPAENMCTKFNLGWDFGINEDECLVTFLPGTKNYSIDNEMNWGNLPHGFRFGGVFSFEDVLGFQLGMNYMNQRSSGKRTDHSTNTIEQFSLKTRMGLFTMNFIFMKNRVIQPLIGFDFGYTTMRFSYDNGSVKYENQRMGYNIKLGGNYVPGDKSITIGFNVGCSINLFGSGPISMKMVPSYQYILTGTGEINQVVYPDLIFNHSNVSLSFLLTYNIGQ